MFGSLLEVSLPFHDCNAVESSSYHLKYFPYDFGCFQDAPQSCGDDSHSYPAVGRSNTVNIESDYDEWNGNGERHANWGFVRRGYAKMV
jgi:hypothetical protein